jgi:thymidylate synthase (FAD)
MKIIEPSAEIVHPGPDEGIGQLQFIELMARISHRSEDKQTLDSWKRFIPAVVMEHGDWSVVEHESATVLFRVDRGITHELVRHRLFSFTQESTRFVNGRKSYPDGLEFIEPEEIKNSENGGIKIVWHNACQSCEHEYFRLLDAGVRPQEARSVLPNSLASTIAVTGNLRNWHHFLLMRTSKETHPDFRRVTIPLLAEFKERIPILYDDIEPNARQIDNLRKPR